MRKLMATVLLSCCCFRRRRHSAIPLLSERLHNFSTHSSCLDCEESHAIHGRALPVDSWLDQVQTRVNQDAIEWLREKLKEDLPRTEQSSHTEGPCETCFLGTHARDRAQNLYLHVIFCTG